jgi:two-component system, NarL family, response regulator DesR
MLSAVQDPGAGLRLLVCDDSAGFRALIAAWFADDPDIASTETVATAAQLLEAIDREPDVVILDRLLPDAGLDRDLAAEIKAVRPGCTVVLVSGMPAEILATQAAGTSADAFASKATTADRLRAIVMDAVRDTAGAQAERVRSRE